MYLYTSLDVQEARLFSAIIIRNNFPILSYVFICLVYVVVFFIQSINIFELDNIDLYDFFHLIVDLNGVYSIFIWFSYGVLHHFQQYFSYIVAVRCIGG